MENEHNILIDKIAISNRKLSDTANLNKYHDIFKVKANNELSVLNKKKR